MLMSREREVQGRFLIQRLIHGSFDGPHEIRLCLDARTVREGMKLHAVAAARAGADAVAVGAYGSSST